MRQRSSAVFSRLRIVRLGDMRDHVSNRASHVLIGEGVKYLLALPIGPQNAGGPQQTQMVADQGWRQLRLCCNIGHASGFVQASQDDPKSARITHKPENLCELHGLVMRN